MKSNVYVRVIRERLLNIAYHVNHNSFKTSY